VSHANSLPGELEIRTGWPPSVHSEMAYYEIKIWRGWKGFFPLPSSVYIGSCNETLSHDIRKAPIFSENEVGPPIRSLKILGPADIRWETSRNFARSHARSVTVQVANISCSLIASLIWNRLHVAISLCQMEAPESPDFATCNSPSTAYISPSPASNPLCDVKFLRTNKATI
jgi:hypothetical protein